MNNMVIDYRLVILGLGILCVLAALVLFLRHWLKMKVYSATVTGKLTGYEDVYETTKEGVQTISQRIFYPIFIYTVDGVQYKKSTAKQFNEKDERPTDVDVPIRYNPAVPADCYIGYQEYPLLTPILLGVIGVIVSAWGLIAVL